MFYTDWWVTLPSETFVVTRDDQVKLLARLVALILWRNVKMSPKVITGAAPPEEGN